MQGNQISDLEDVAPFLSTIQYLQNLDIRDNPLSRIKKYRDQIIMIGLSIQNLDNKEVTEHERQYLLTLELRKKGVKVPKKEVNFEIAGQRNWYGRGGHGQAKKTVKKLPKGYKMTSLGDRPPVKAGLSIVGNELEIHHHLDEKENEKMNRGGMDGYSPPDSYPTYEELMRHATLPSNIQINKK